ncbi:MAG: hypothetical protein R2873_10110 [Caldilineaceae bacterium]
MGEYLCHTRGDVLRPPRLHRSICVTAFTTEPAAQRQAVRAAYSEHFARFGIDDAGSLTYWLTQERNLPRELVVSLLRFTRHDPLVLKRCLPSLNDESERWGDAELDVLVEEIAQVWANYYDQGDRYNLPFELGVFMERLHRPAQAIFYYGEALHYYGDTPETLFNLATCYHGSARIRLHRPF